MPRKKRELKPADEHPQVMEFVEPPPVNPVIAAKNLQELRQAWDGIAAGWLKGRTIVDVRYWTEEERSQITYGNRGRGIRLFLDNGVEVDVMSDDEGNGPGALHLFNPRGALGKQQEILPVVS